MLNHIVVMGRMARDPELRRTGKGDAVANFTLAVERDFAAQSGEKEVDFIDCVAWRKTAEFVSKFFTKGKMAAVSGRLELRRWADKDGNKRTSAEINATNVYFADSKRDSDSGGNSYGSNNYGSSSFPEAEEALRRYGAPGGYAAPEYAQQDFAMLEDDDAQLPF